MSSIARSLNRAAMCCALAFISVAFAVAAPVCAQQMQQRPQLVGLEVGISEFYKLGQWTPVRVTILGGAEQLVGRVEIVSLDGDGVPCSYVAPGLPDQLLPGRPTEVTLYVRMGSSDELTVQFRTERGLALQQRVEYYGDFGELPVVLPRAYYDSARVALCLGRTSGLDELFTSRGGQGEYEAESYVEVDERPLLELLALRNLASLPTRAIGYDAIDAVVLTTSQPQLFDRLEANGPVLEALDEWVRLGGKLLITCGVEAHSLFREGGLLERFAPGDFAGVATLDSTTAIEAYTYRNAGEGPRRSRGRIPRGLIEANPLQVARFENIVGAVELSEGDLPLVIRRPYGLGELVIATVDPDQPPLSDWKGRGEFAFRLLTGQTYQAAKDEQDKNRSSDPYGYHYNYGYNDLAGQLRAGLDKFLGVRVVPFFVVGLLVFFYILLIGPGDYLLVRHVLKRMELTWITFPTMVVIVSLGAWFLAHTLKGSQTRVNQVDVVDIDAASGLVRGTTFINMFSPNTARYDMRYQPPTLASHDAASRLERHQATFTWLGMPGEGFAGNHRRRAMLFLNGYSESQDLQGLEDAPIQVWSSKSFWGRWSGSLGPLDAGDLQRNSDGTLEGTIRNPLDVPLTDCVVLYDRQAYEVGNLGPAEEVEIVSSRKRDLVSYLHDFYVQADPSRVDTHNQYSTPYDRGGLDVPTVLRQMMFYDASGGVEYSHLVNRYAGYLDLSRQLDLGRAVLLAKRVVVGDADVGAAAAVEAFGATIESNATVAAEGRVRYQFQRLTLPVVAATRPETTSP